jgi:DNA-binding NarL/FixJ family response regulator
MTPIKLILVDDHAVVRSGLRRLLELNKCIEVIAEADCGEQAYQRYGELQPDIVVMDISMPGMGGLESARRIVQRYPAAKIIIFSMHISPSFVSQALKSGVRAYVTKTGAAEELILAVIAVASGGAFISAEIAKKLTQEILSGQDDPMHQLSGREFEVFRFLAEGKKVEVVADMLKISPKTVANYYTTIKQKLGVVSPIEMVRLAMRHGLIDG